MNQPLPPFVHLNGKLLAAARAHVSVFDRGLLYGDGLFETLRAYRGKPFALDEHLTRLRKSAGFLGIRIPRRPWVRDIDALLKRNGLSATDAWVRITVTRGVAAPRLLPPAGLLPTVIIGAGRLAAVIARNQRRGVRVTLLPFARHGFMAEHKVLDYLPGILGKAMAARHRGHEGLFVDADGYVVEGTTSNVFVCHGNRLLTPAGPGILPGITRRLVMEIAGAHGIRVSERPLRAREVIEADEVFLTSSLVEVLPVTRVDQHVIGDGAVGPRTRQIQYLYRQMVDRAPARA